MSDEDISVIGMKEFARRFGATTDLDDDEAKVAIREHPDRFWTMVTGDGGDGLVPGSQWVNRYGFCLSERARTPEETEEIQWVDTTGLVYAIVCTNPECDSFEEESTTYSAIDNDDGTFTCNDCEGPNRLLPGKLIDGIE